MCVLFWTSFFVWEINKVSLHGYLLEVIMKMKMKIYYFDQETPKTTRKGTVQPVKRQVSVFCSRIAVKLNVFELHSFVCLRLAIGQL